MVVVVSGVVVSVVSAGSVVVVSDGVVVALVVLEVPGVEVGVPAAGSFAWYVVELVKYIAPVKVPNDS
jgi:hypothetical protein